MKNKVIYAQKKEKVKENKLATVRTKIIKELELFSYAYRAKKPKAFFGASLTEVCHLCMTFQQIFSKIFLRKDLSKISESFKNSYKKSKAFYNRDDRILQL